METKRCAACHKHFHPRPQSPDQKFCSTAECKRERKRRWQKIRRAADSDYRDNDVQANRQWRSRHPGYWRAYRRKLVICHAQAQAKNSGTTQQIVKVKRLMVDSLLSAFIVGKIGNAYQFRHLKQNRK